jgi:excisionase family DNA binding protein
MVMKLLTIPEACEQIRISRATLYKLIKRGVLPLVKIGGKSLITEEALQKLLRTEPTAEGSEEQMWEQYYEDLLRCGLTTRESCHAIVRPQFSDFVPIEVMGTPASELIIAERGER